MWRIVSLVLLVTVTLACALQAQPASWWQPQPDAEVLLDLPMDPAAAAVAWTGAEPLTAIDDDILGRQVLSPAKGTYLWSREPVAGDYEVEVLLRWPDPAARRTGATLFLAAEGHPNSPAYGYRVMLRPGAPGAQTLGVTVARGSVANNLLDRKPRSSDGRTVTFRPRYSDISPVWDPEFRTEIEQAMARVPPPDTSWIRLRFMIQDRLVTIYKDGYCIGRYDRGDRLDGRLMLALPDPQLRIAGLTVTRPAAAGRFTTVALDDRVNASAVDAGKDAWIAADSLPGGGARGIVGSIPFRLANRERGHDHIDVGHSLFHYRAFSGGVSMRLLWPAASELDSNRILLNIPNRPYRRAWLLAATDGEPASIPRLTLRVVKPHAGWPIDAVAEVPAFDATPVPGGARPLPVKAPDGSERRLWLVPVELDSQRIAREYRHEETMMVELTQATLPYRSTPDPANFSWFQGGSPSGVRLFGLTFEEAPLAMTATGNRPGNAYVLPDTPVWEVTLANHTDAGQRGRLVVAVEEEAQAPLDVELLPREVRTIRLPLAPTRFGLHHVASRFTHTGGDVLVDAGTFVQLPLDTRRTTEKNSRWGLWTWYGGHGTNPDLDENAYLLRAAGARGAGPGGGGDRYTLRRTWGLAPRPAGISYRAPEWLYTDPDNAEKIAAFQREMVDKAKKLLEDSPDSPYLAFFVEDVADIPLMFGEYPHYLGESGTESWTPEQKRLYEGRFKAAKLAFEALRKEVPQARLSLGWTHPQFQIPLLRMGFPAELFDIIGIDFPTFMRMPEMPLRDISPNRMWLLQQEMKRLGYADKPVVHHETYFPTSHTLALGHRTSADYFVRFGALAIQLGSEKLANCFSLHDCAGYWGSQHYGSIGIVGRAPMYNPKEAFAAYATMTRLLDMVKPNGYLPTGSLTSYCLAFLNQDTTRPYAHVHTLWTVRGERPVTLTFAPGETAVRIDENGNAWPIELTAENQATLTLTPTPFWITTTQPIQAAAVGDPVHREAPQGPTRELATFHAGWKLAAAPYTRLESNNPVLAPFAAGPMALETVDFGGRPALQVALRETPESRPTVDWYGVLEPAAPLAIAGQARALGLYVKGASSWGRVIYEIEDAKGERWLSTGAPNNWNGDDSAQRSYFNFDGARYVEFPLPRSAPYDSYRDYENVWWGHDQEGIVDLPIKLTKVVITHRTHHVYVNELLAIPDPSVVLDRLVAVYDREDDLTELPVERQRLATLRIEPPDPALLPNPVKQLQATSDLPAPSIVRFFKPDAWYDGTQIMVEISKAEGDVRAYNIYVSAYEDGTGASRLSTGAEPTQLVRRLRPEFPLYFFATYTNARRQESKPSAVQRLLLKDDFPNK